MTRSFARARAGIAYHFSFYLTRLCREDVLGLGHYLQSRQPMRTPDLDKHGDSLRSKATQHNYYKYTTPTEPL